METRLFVGLDLGGSGTRAALADANGRVLATGKGGSVSQAAAGPASRRSLARALDAALAPIGPLISGQDCVIYAGVAGLSLPGRREQLSIELSARFPRAQVHLASDALIALWGGLAGQEGVAVLAGTGSIALARSADGRQARAGGWGYLLGDEGGGYWLGHAAVTCLLRTLEGRAPPATLSQLVGTALGQAASSAPGVIAWLHADRSPVTRLASLAPLVSQAADRGDAGATEILARAARALAELAAAAATQVWSSPIPEHLPVACCGGVWAAGPGLTRPFGQALAERLPRGHARAPRLPPLGGAVLLAMDAGGLPPEPEAVETLKGWFPS